MTENTQAKLEEKVQILRKSLEHGQWSDANFLLKKVDETEQSDIALAFRLMQRVKNLEPNTENLERLKALRSKALELHPELSQSSSTTNNAKQGLLSGLKNLAQGYTESNSIDRLKQPIVVYVFLPFLLFAIYQNLIASERFESQAQIIVKEPNGMATLDPGMAVLSGFGMGGAANSDIQLVSAFIHSADMLAYLDERIQLIDHYSDTQYDYFSRLSTDDSFESKLSYFIDMVSIEIDDNSQVLNLKTQAFTPDMSHQLNLHIVDRAEWYINEISQNLAKNQLSFVQTEHELVQSNLSKAKAVLLDFQRKYNLLDPEAEGAALQQISYQLESLISAKRTELRALQNSMSDKAPLVLQAQAELDSLIQQLENERNRLTEEGENTANQDQNIPKLGVGEILAKYSEYKINMELALQAYTSSLVSLEKSRIEAYRQVKYLVVVEASTMPESAAYPKVLYNLILFLLASLMIFGIVKIILATVDELR